LSYILDALKKSEQERSRGTVPDIKTIHEPGTALPARSSSRIYVILMVLLFVVAGLGYWIVYEKSRHSATRSRLLDSDEIVTSPSSDSDAAAALNSTESEFNGAERTGGKRQSSRFLAGEKRFHEKYFSIR